MEICKPCVRKRLSHAAIIAAYNSAEFKEELIKRRITGLQINLEVQQMHRREGITLK